MSPLFIMRLVSSGATTVSFISLCARGLGKRYRNYVASLSYGFYPSDKAPPYGRSCLLQTSTGWEFRGVRAVAHPAPCSTVDVLSALKNQARQFGEARWAFLRCTMRRRLLQSAAKPLRHSGAYRRRRRVADRAVLFTKRNSPAPVYRSYPGSRAVAGWGSGLPPSGRVYRYGQVLRSPGVGEIAAVLILHHAVE